MKSLTVKISPALEEAIAVASAQAHVSKSELVRRALEAYLRQRDAQLSFAPALEQAGDLVGCFAGPPADLSSNPEHLSGFGRS
jgi:Arc/MetJ-type ribon-helix-helix transcriptional regulator